MFDNLKAMAQLGPMMARIREVQARLPTLRAEGSAGGSLVTAVANGNLEIVSITYATTAPLTDTELLSDLTRAAVNQAIHNVKALMEKEMSQATGGLDLGMMRNLLGQ